MSSCVLLDDSVPTNLEMCRPSVGDLEYWSTGRHTKLRLAVEDLEDPEFLFLRESWDCSLGRMLAVNRNLAAADWSPST